MSLILSGTNGLSDVNGTASAPALTGTDTDTGVFFPAANTLGLSTGGTERLRLDSSGNLGLGVTPSTWGSGYKAIDISPIGAVYSVSGYFGYQTNAYYNGTNNIYKTTGYATDYYSNSGIHVWRTAPSGTAGNPITFTQAMTLDASGKLQLASSSTTAGLYVENTTSGSNSYSAYIRQTDATFSGNVLSVVGSRATTNSSYLLCQMNNGNGSGLFRIFDSGAIYSNTLGTGILYSNAGTLTSTNPSDERLKDNITDLSFGLQQILALRPVSYNWKSDTISQGTQYGFIAQEVQTVMPELVREFETTDGEETVTRFGLEKEGIYAALVKAIQEQQQIITQLQADVAALKGQA